MTATAAFPALDSGQPLLRQAYRIGPMRFATAFEDARELAAMPHVARLPGVPQWVRGLANLHGHPVPVFDIASLLGVAHDASAVPMLLVVGEGARIGAIVIDGAPRRLRVEPTAVREAGEVPWALARHVSHALVDGDAIWLEFDPARYLEALAEVLGIRETWTS